MKITITIDTANDAFQHDHLNSELARILKGITVNASHGMFERLIDWNMPRNIYDINGNLCGLIDAKE